MSEERSTHQTMQARILLRRPWFADQTGVTSELLCRYLAESSCAGMCVNLCKSPVQTFFTRELGMPLTMKPNFEDYSCEMVFGEGPPPQEQDEAYRQTCLSTCPAASANAKGPQCPKLQ